MIGKTLYMSTFVLVHGAYHGAWCWSRLMLMLEASGHKVIAVDLPGHGDNVHPVAEVTLGAYTAAVCQIVATADEPVILVGHSMAGAIVAGVAEVMPDRIRRLVFLTAYIPVNGTTIPDLVRADTQYSIPVERVDEGGVPCLRLVPSVAHRHFYHDADDDDWAWVQPKLADQALAPFVGSLTITDGGFGRVSHAYIFCRYDRAISLSLQRRMAIAADCEPTHYLKSGHSPFVSQPGILTQVLLTLT